ncbi:MAG TPA: phosphoribosylamine--glycine ligase [Actinomycetota bacterium]|nr:phosphoribosylamine--glycine ligase [Actinomycetota bacterium]
MRLLVVGSGGREHALVWKLAQNPTVERLYAAPGNPGMAGVASLVPIAADDVAGLVSFAEEQRIDLTVIGPEAPLVAGLADQLAARGLRVFGPRAQAARIEGSKVFCRSLAARLGVPMARGESFEDPDLASDFVKTMSPPVVVKAEGLAAGKGVLICEDHPRATEVIDQMMRGGAFGGAGSRVVIEEFLQGRETSMLCITDGETILPLDPAQDYKRIWDGDTGLNTGGMGSYSPVPWLAPKTRQAALDRIIRPLVQGLNEEGSRFCGCFYAGLMISDGDPYLIEVNARFGDPETQALMPRMSSDLAEAMLAAVEGNLSDYKLGWNDTACVSVVVASEGYPGPYETGVPVEGIAEVSSGEVVVFHAGTEETGGRLVSSGGRVLSVSALGTTIPEARDRAYKAAGGIGMRGKYMRTDIAKGVS